VTPYFTQVPDLIWVRVPLWLWVLVAAKAVALTDRATRAATATIMDFFMVVLLGLLRVEVDVRGDALLYAGAGFDRGLDSGLALGGGKGGGAYRQGNEGGYGDGHGFFHGGSPWCVVGLMVEVDVTCCELFHAGAGLDLGTRAALALGLGGGKGCGAEGKGNKGGDGDDHGLFHSGSPWVSDET